MDYYKNELINKTLKVFYNTFAQTLDTSDFTPKEFNKKIHKYIYKNLKLKFNEIEIYNLLHLQEKGYQLGIFQKLKIFFSGLKPLYIAEQQKLATRKQKCSAVVKERADYFCPAKIDEPLKVSALDNGTNETN